MRLADPRLWLAALTLAGIVAIAAANARPELPGELASVHAQLPELDGGDNCAACHGGWFSDLTDSCRECHPAIGAQIDGGHGLHGRLREPGTCGLCHSEHNGADFDLVHRASWSLAGVPDPLRFDHGMVGFQLAGRHLELGCVDCHEHARDKVLAAGHGRYLGLQRDCASCHRDPHEGAMVVRCDQCHGQESFQVPASLGHERFVALEGAHGELACTVCHPAGGPRSIMTIGRSRLRHERTCADCHPQPHDEGMLAAAVPVAPAPAAAVAAAPAGETAAAPTGSSCAACHLGDHRSFADAAKTMTPARHAATGFPLDGPHGQVACAGCHPTAGTFAQRHPDREATACHSCHSDPHGGQFERSPMGADGCVSCHARTQFTPPAFGVAEHERTALPLTGRHRDVACSACHLRPEPDGPRDPEQPRRFHGTPWRCDACHQDVHGAAFAVATAELAATHGGTCARCHDTEDFGNARAAFDHAHFTGYSLDGAHAAARCETCHPRSNTPDADGRTLGRVRDSDGRFRGCATCHSDPHDGRFDLGHLPIEVDGRRDCARCHDAVSFRQVTGEFEHDRWTGFPLLGAHAEVACGSCHVQPAKDGHGVARPFGRECGDCHADRHGGQFGARPDCRSCHRVTGTFGESTFDHERQARFALGDAHAKVPCASCHETVDVRGTAIVRYRPVPHECTDCHGQQQDPLRRRARQQEGRR